MQGVFVFDCVVHAYNMADANLLNRSDALLGRDSIVGLGAQTRAPANQDLYPTFAKDWSLEELEDMVFGRSVTDLAMAQTVPIFDWFKDGFAPVQAQYEFASAYPDRVLFCGGVDPSYHGAAAPDEMQRQVEEMGRARSSSTTRTSTARAGAVTTKRSPTPCTSRPCAWASTSSSSTRACPSATRTWRTCAPTTSRRRRATSPTCAL